jgi:succinate dehydrogenase/fumarate reductase cytochrome b subunit
MYPFFRGAHFYYYDILGLYVSTPLFTSLHEQNVIYIWSNVSVLLPFCVTLGFCLAVVGRLAQYRGTPRPGVHLELQLPQPVSVLAPTSKNNSFTSPRRLTRLLTKMRRLPTSQAIRAKHGGMAAKQRARAKEKNNIVAIIITVYVLCLLPGILLGVYELLNNFNLLPESASITNMSDRMLSVYIYIFLIFSTLLFTLNSCINPFIYYFRCNPICILPRPLARLLYIWKVRFQS